MSSVQVHESTLPEGRYGVSAHGAHVTTWWSALYGDLLYLSSSAAFEPSKAIRGGIPICFPWFGGGRSGTLTPSHGMARLASWREIDWQDDEASSTVRAVYALDSDDVEGMPGSESFEHEFTLRYEVELSPRSALFRLRIRNDSETEYSCEVALHTYLRISDVAGVTVNGLDGADYVDKTDHGARKTQHGAVVLGDEVDRLYDSNAEVRVHDTAMARTIHLTKAGAGQTVVWNPGEAKAATMTDVGPGEWRTFVCIEAAAAGDGAIRVAAGEEHVLEQRIDVQPFGAETPL